MTTLKTCSSKRLRGPPALRFKTFGVVDSCRNKPISTSSQFSFLSLLSLHSQATVKCATVSFFFFNAKQWNQLGISMLALVQFDKAPTVPGKKTFGQHDNVSVVFLEWEHFPRLAFFC